MLKKFVVIILCNFTFLLYSQKVDKIEVRLNIYSGDFFSNPQREKLHSSEKRIIKDQKLIEKLIVELSDTENIWEKFSIDTAYIKNNPSKILKLYDNRNNILWNRQQLEFINKKITDPTEYLEKINEYIGVGSHYSMHSYYKNEYIITLYSGAKPLKEFKSRKHTHGFKFPWTDEKGNVSYNFKIDRIINNFYGLETKYQQPLFNKDLLKLLVNKIVDSNIRELYKLSAYTYISDIEKLKDEFEVKSFEEVYGRGRYIWDDSQTIKISLHNNTMLPNVNIQFLAKKVGKQLYPQDSLKLKYKDVVKKIQEIPFITNYLKENQNSKLDIYFFNNTTINDYNVRSIENSCNTIYYRYGRKVLENAIFFELIDEQKNNSVWFLLPDNTIFLYLMDGEKVLNHSHKEFGQYSGTQFPCKIFNLKGEIVH